VQLMQPVAQTASRAAYQQYVDDTLLFLFISPASLSSSLG